MSQCQCPLGLELLRKLRQHLNGDLLSFNALTGLSCYITDMLQTQSEDVSMPSRA